VAEMQTPLEPGETLVKQGQANMRRGIESVGGHLYLTDRRLVFESHRLNIQRGATEVPLADIAGMEKRWTKLLKLIPIIPNTLAVQTTQGEEHSFVCYGRDAWIAAVEQQRGGAAG
jgi:hypothetical protein